MLKRKFSPYLLKNKPHSANNGKISAYFTSAGSLMSNKDRIQLLQTPQITIFMNKQNFQTKFNKIQESNSYTNWTRNGGVNLFFLS